MPSSLILLGDYRHDDAGQDGEEVEGLLCRASKLLPTGKARPPHSPIIRSNRDCFPVFWRAVSSTALRLSIISWETCCISSRSADQTPAGSGRLGATQPGQEPFHGEGHEELSSANVRYNFHRDPITMLSGRINRWREHEDIG